MARPRSEATSRQLDRWPPKARALFDELLDDAGSEVQRELLQRAVAAAHSPAEVHAFADELRGMSDQQAYQACTLHDGAPQGFSVAQLLRAESDPLYAFELKGGTIEPNEAEAALAPAPMLSEGPKPLRALDVQRLDPLSMRVSTKGLAPTFNSSSNPVLVPTERPATDSKRTAVSSGPRAAVGRTLASLLEEATAGLRMTWTEQDIDVPLGLTLARAVTQAFEALGRGWPVVATLGPNPGDHRRFVILLQQSSSGRSRAAHVFDPLSSELHWVNENDLASASELPFANKAHRRLTRVVLPDTLRAFL